jgi:tetratricopeptide (TPR) repeat protein
MRRRISRWRSRTSTGEEDARSAVPDEPVPVASVEAADVAGAATVSGVQAGAGAPGEREPVGPTDNGPLFDGVSADEAGGAVDDPAAGAGESSEAPASRPSRKRARGGDEPPDPAAPLPIASVPLFVTAPAPAAPLDERAQRLAHAEWLVEENRLAEAIDAYRGLLIDQPKDVSSRIAIGRLYERKGDTQLALEQYEAARTEDAENVDVLLCVAGVNATLRQFDAAERELRRAARLDPTRAAVYSQLGTVNFRRGLYAQAEQELKRAIELDPTDAHAYFHRGEALNQLYRVDEALDMLERAVALQPGIPRAYYIMGILFDKKGRSREAADMYRRAREVGAA